MRIAAKVAARKQQHPELYCAVPRCLYRTDDEYCPNHRRQVLGFSAAPSPFDDPEWRRQDTERSDNHPWRAKP